MKLAKKFLIAALILIIAAMLIVLPACSKKQKSYEQIVHEFYEDRKDKLPDWVTEEFCVDYYRNKYWVESSPLPSPMVLDEPLSPDDYAALYDEWHDYTKEYVDEYCG